MFNITNYKRIYFFCLKSSNVLFYYGCENCNFNRGVIVLEVVNKSTSSISFPFRSKPLVSIRDDDVVDLDKESNELLLEFCCFSDKRLSI